MDYEQQLRSMESKFLLASTRTQMITSFASVAINSIILANSAAAGAILAFLASLPRADRVDAMMSHSVYCLKVFTVGSFLGILCALTSYLAQSLYSSSELAEVNSAAHKRFQRAARISHAFALACGLIGALCFPLGAFYGLDALRNW